MFKTESKVMDFIRKHVIIIGFIAVSAVAFAVRLAFFDYKTYDYYGYMVAWINQLKEYEGLKGIGQNIGEYNVPYMLFLNIVGRTSYNDLYEVKAFSVLFDYLCAWIIMRTAIGKRKILSPWGLAIWTAVLLSPVSFLDSGFWAQCDSIYTSLCIVCFYYLLNEKPVPAMIFYGIAFAMKLQAIFFLPVLLIYYVASRKISILHFLIVPAVYSVMVLPAIIVGRSVSDTFRIYFAQTDLYHNLTISCPNIYNIISGDYDMFKKMGIFLTIAVLGAAACYFMYFKIKSNNAYIYLAFWSSYLCVFLLPSMHDRYSYLSCMLSILWAAVCKKDWWIAAAVNIITLISWAPYLMQRDIMSFEYLSIINLALVLYITYRLFTIHKSVPCRTQIQEAAE